MTAKQTALYFREWSKARAVFIARGLDPLQADAKRHALHVQALGADVSSKNLTNRELDKVLASFLAISRPGDLAAQLRQDEQAAGRHTALQQRARELAAHCVSSHGLEGRYLDGLARKVFGAEKYEHLDERGLGQLCGILARRRSQMSRHASAGGRQAVGELTPHSYGR